MPAPVWPPTLPAPDRRNISWAPRDARLKSKTDTGPGKVRLRSTAQITDLSFTIQTDATGLATFTTFYYTTTVLGSLSFDYVRPDTAATVTARFGDAVPKWNNLGGDRWEVQVALELMP